MPMLESWHILIFQQDGYGMQETKNEPGGRREYQLGESTLPTPPVEDVFICT